MALIEDIRKDRMVAMKDRDQFVKSVLTTLLSESERPGLDDGKRPSTDVEVIKVCKKFINGLDESIANTNSDSDLGQARISEYIREKNVIEHYIPKQMTGLELEKAVAKYIDSVEDQTVDMGMVMKYLRENYDGLYNGSDAAVLIKALLT